MGVQAAVLDRVTMLSLYVREFRGGQSKAHGDFLVLLHVACDEMLQIYSVDHRRHHARSTHLLSNVILGNPSALCPPTA
jgi:hypothetical protein